MIYLIENLGSFEQPKNIDAPIKYINHASLSSHPSFDSPYIKICPVCKDGLLMVRRNPKTLKIMPEDNCTLCGQTFYYKDYLTIK